MAKIKYDFTKIKVQPEIQLIIENRAFENPLEILKIKEITDIITLKETNDLIVKPLRELKREEKVQDNNSKKYFEHKSSAFYGYEITNTGVRIFIENHDKKEIFSVGINLDNTIDYSSFFVFGLSPFVFVENPPKVNKLLYKQLHSSEILSIALLWEEKKDANFPSEYLESLNILTKHLYVYQHYTRPKKKVSSVRQYTTDGCTVVPDFNFTSCCNSHDICYDKGGTEGDRLNCDKKMYECIKKKANIFIAALYYSGVRALSRSHFNYTNEIETQTSLDGVPPNDPNGNCNYTIKLVNVEYESTSDNIGNDWKYKIMVDDSSHTKRFGEHIFNHGENRGRNTNLFSGNGNCGTIYSHDIYITATEVDSVFDDIGSNNFRLSFRCNNNNHTFHKEVEIEEGVYWPDIAILDFSFRVVTSGCL